MCFQVYMCPGSAVLVPIHLKICVALLTPFPRDIECKEVEGFHSFGTKVLRNMLCDHRRQQHSRFGCRVGSDVSLSIFATESSTTGQLRRPPRQRRAFAAVEVC